MTDQPIDQRIAELTLALSAMLEYYDYDRSESRLGPTVTPCADARKVLENKP